MKTPKQYNSIDDLALDILKTYKNKSSNNNPFMILIAGCSRSGKSTLSKSLKYYYQNRGQNTQIIKLDSWIIPLNKRISGASVLDRYEGTEIIKSIKKLLSGSSIEVPVYNSVTRDRSETTLIFPSLQKTDILIVEGVIALALKELLELSQMNIFVEVRDDLRKLRVIDFYSQTKSLGETEAHHIFESRELDETPIVKESKKNADSIFHFNEENSKS